jgi:CheY-like chemotaxis protein
MSHRTKAILCLCHDSNMLLVRRMLLEHFGYIVLPTTSAEDAKAIVQRQCPDMLLMDNGDSGVDWRKLAEQVKQICPEVITVVLAPFFSSVQPGSSTSVDRFVAKDDGPDALVAQIQELLDGSDQATRRSN